MGDAEAANTFEHGNPYCVHGAPAMPARQARCGQSHNPKEAQGVEPARMEFLTSQQDFWMMHRIGLFLFLAALRLCVKHESATKKRRLTQSRRAAERKKKRLEPACKEFLTNQQDFWMVHRIGFFSSWRLCGSA
jgi:hypothetical protein